MIPPDLPIVLPHQEGLDLRESTVEKEQKLVEEVEMLRKKLDAVFHSFIIFSTDVNYSLAT